MYKKNILLILSILFIVLILLYGYYQIHYFKLDKKIITNKEKESIINNRKEYKKDIILYYENNEIVGIDADIAQAICDKLGYELKIEDMEFDSIINAVQSGKADIGVAGMTVTEDRLKNIDFTNPYTTATQVIIVRKK